MVLQLLYRHLALVVADDHVVDRGLAQDARKLLTLLRHHRLEAVRCALADQHDAGGAYHAVHCVHVGIGRHAGLRNPLHTYAITHVGQSPCGGSRLAFDLVVHAGLQATGECPHRRDHADYDADDQVQPPPAENQAEQQHQHNGNQEGQNHKRDKLLIPSLLQLKGLPQLGARLLALLLLRSLGSLLLFLDPYVLFILRHGTNNKA